jgi:hypothetical protein
MPVTAFLGSTNRSTHGVRAEQVDSLRHTVRCGLRSGPMSDDGDEVVIIYGNAQPGDTCFADVVAVDGEIVELLRDVPLSFW